MKTNIYEMNMLLEEELEMVVGGTGCEKKNCFMIKYTLADGQTVVAYFKDYLDAVKFCRRVGVDPSTMEIVEWQFD